MHGISGLPSFYQKPLGARKRPRQRTTGGGLEGSRRRRPAWRSWRAIRRRLASIVEAACGSRTSAGHGREKLRSQLQSLRQHFGSVERVRGTDRQEQAVRQRRAVFSLFYQLGTIVPNRFRGLAFLVPAAFDLPFFSFRRKDILDAR